MNVQMPAIVPDDDDGDHDSEEDARVHSVSEMVNEFQEKAQVFWGRPDVTSLPSASAG